ncbi:MAG: hypothetical protein A3H69_00125 [Candidatus Sungbacteria bacterium RIFCSPLOWO2_02_FULL_47_9]|uniref:alanine--tRNA ligase n=1 Tax=Candidatus Sungbacteria bacterium RIFCSPHIGHO2_01_FULL_47_32 TaxID=1802264 RepID=A0A1G2K4Q6_9BACT|nr:MAG: Alanine-tRNA ligase [Parcubacteria group bacterium GW2011_GWA2_47_10]OGZ94419.1 MAG: hypothetical protein A2633_04030 [Candidatus Sungbacteria bacterium RIFCSPHIGHO2_01_FULL_47_32]OGZ98011.1 MAG: hypothetical protein A3D57_02735 [Candidatus Sungbacteria bacterium RIFCSPHIGHO2_02_FULL_46_12]OHA05761.1 MAG: hypothetical protein A3A28_05495 [Candidatus Sungbacteria bacterium RIFCSPLOWO2_01_FULL_47_32]OHA12176.1 MAG: hypothetical protein A3H69_00125 [Candidatus Sungbacteria bacterium RIFCSP
MEAIDIRKKFLKFFEERGHTIVPSSSLIPDDPSVLLTTAGMQQFKKYYMGEADPYMTIHPLTAKPLGSKSAASAQKSFRTSDIDEVGDEGHLTFFEMLGNFSFGYKPGESSPKSGYFKKGAITYAFDFITKEMELSISYVTIFKGSDAVPKDEESRSVWNSLGVTDVREEGMEDVFWGPTGTSGPCGPTTEVYCKTVAGKDVEIWNIVFNEFFYPGSREELLSGSSGKKLESLKVAGVDTGMGFERLVMISQKKATIFDTDLFAPLLELLSSAVELRHKRIIVDHLRAMSFLIADGVRPSNKEAGYVLRRLMRRAFVYEHMYQIPPHVFDALVHDIVHEYGEFYPELLKHNDDIREEMKKEYDKFANTLKQGVKKLKEVKEDSITAESAFRLYESFGLPYEIIKELGGAKTASLTREAFDAEFKRHQEISRAGQEKKFGGHGLLLDTGELKAANEEELKKVTRLHTATHLLQAALRKVIGSEVHQDGSDITVERTRFDFTFPRKLTPEEIKQAENVVNEVIQKDMQMTHEEMSYEDALKSGALHFFKEKYPLRVSIYTVSDKKTGEVFSKEFCGGPHVTHTGEIGSFKIIKEEASSAGVRRIRAAVEDKK